MHRAKKFANAAMITAAGAVTGLAAGCGSDTEEGDAALSIVGDRTLRVDAGAEIELEVRYHDPDRVPLAGEVEFSIHGDPGGGVSLDATTVATDDYGGATAILDTGSSSDVEFEVRAEAHGAPAAVWEIAVEPIPPLQPNGTYAMHSSLNVASGLPGHVGTAVNLVIDITEGPGAPTRWIVYQILDYIPGDYEFTATDLVIQAVNGLLLSLAPNIVSQLLDAGEAFGGIATDLGVITHLEISGEPGDRTATHTVTGFALRINNNEHVFSFDEIGLEKTPVTDIGVSFDEVEQRLVIDEHDLSVSYGTFLIFVLEYFLLRDVEGSLGDFLASEIDCAAVAETLADELDRGSLFELAARTACNEALKRGGDRIVEAFEGVDGIGMTLRIAGDAIAADTAGDRRIDDIEGGHWAGEVQVADQSSALLREDNTFAAERLAESD